MVNENLGDLSSFDVYKAEFSMGMLDYNRFHKLLVILDELAILVKEEEISVIQKYFAVLHQLYINLRVGMYDTVRKKFEERLEKLQEFLKDWKRQIAPKKFPQTFVDKLLEFHEELLYTKQKMGLGFLMEREESTTEKLEKASDLEEFEYAR